MVENKIPIITVYEVKIPQSNLTNEVRYYPEAAQAFAKSKTGVREIRIKMCVSPKDACALLNNWGFVYDSNQLT
jgi:hypothetical protein